MARRMATWTMGVFLVLLQVLLLVFLVGDSAWISSSDPRSRLAGSGEGRGLPPAGSGEGRGLPPACSGEEEEDPPAHEDPRRDEIPGVGPPAVDRIPD